jgi:hypothetical protein
MPDNLSTAAREKQYIKHEICTQQLLVRTEISCMQLSKLEHWKLKRTGNSSLSSQSGAANETLGG